MIKDLSSSNILIVGLARNCERKLANEVQKINSAFSASASINWLVIESDSDDDTIGTLNKLSVDDTFRFVSLGKLRAKYPKRTERIAKCRNFYLEEIKGNLKYNNIDYVVVADLDGVNSKLTPKSVQSCWELSVDWDACFANQSAPYYDIWALRHDLWSSNDCFEQEAFFKKFTVDDFYNRYTSILSKMISIPKEAAPIRVKSAFGGLAIYKKQWLLKGKYVGVTDNGDEVCEHVHFHINYLKNASLYIVPSLINCGWNEHSKHRSKIYMYSLFFATRFFSIDKIKEFKKYISRK
jgi:hypothetical protein